MGMKPLGLNDALATPMYNVFSPTPVNSAPVNNIPTKVNLLTRNTLASPYARESSRAATWNARPAATGGARQHHLEIGLRGQQHAATTRTECGQRQVSLRRVPRWLRRRYGRAA